VDQHRRFGVAKRQILIIVSVAGAFAWLITTRTFMPPVGLNLFAAHALFRMPLPELCRGVMPFQYGDVDSYHLCAGDHARLAVSAQVSWSGKNRYED
jgi:TRAP-type C4-dicarboxylate transport system permease large subunit